MDDIRWFAPNAYAGLIVPELRRAGLSIALEGTDPARLALAMSATVAVPAWRYARSVGCPLLIYIWDLEPDATSSGSYDPVWSVAGHLLRLPRPLGGFPRRRGYYSRLRYIAAQAQEIWAPSEMTRLTVESRLGLASRRVPYCYDSERFRPTDRVRDTPATLVTVSRLEPYKNHAATLRAAARLGDNVKVRLIGRGPEHEALERLAGSLGVQCRIDTHLGDAEVARAYQQARVVVCPSRFEGFGLTPIEAVASGTVVVASDIPPHREFVGTPSRFFPLDDDAALAAAIELALDDPAPDPGSVRDLTIPAAAQRFLHLLDPLLQ